MDITPSQITLYVNIFGLVVIGIGFLIGLMRGSFKATYRFLVSLVIIVGLWFLTPTIFSWFINFDVGTTMKNFTSNEVNGYTVTTIKDLLEFATKVILGLIEQTDTGWTTYTGDLVITETQTYMLLYGLFEMLFRVIFIVLVLILNWTIFRVIFGIVYLIIRPKRKEIKNGKKKRAKPTGLSRLTGGLIGAANAVFILFLIFVPLSGIFSIGEDVGTLVDKATTTQEDGKQIAYLAIGGEVVKLSEPTLAGFGMEDIDDWAGVYRASFVGQMFSIKVDGVAIDNRVFDDLFVVKTDNGNVRFREEINNVAAAVGVIADKVYDPLKANDFKFSWDIIDKLDGESITQAFDKLSDLKLIQVVVPVGVEFISNQSRNLNISSDENQMFDVVEVVNSIKDANMKNVISKLGESFGSLLDAVHDSNLTIKDMMEAEDPVQNMLDSLLSINGEGVSNVFNALADIEILDALSKPLGSFLDDYVTNQLSGLLLMKPGLYTDSDGYIYINGEKTNIVWDGHTSLDDMEVSLSDDGFWILNGTLTNIDGSSSQYKLDFTNISISQEIRNIGNIFRAFQDLGINSITDFANYLSGKENEIDWDNTNFDFEHLEKLFNSILANPDDYYFTYSKEIVENEVTYGWKLNYDMVKLDEFGIELSGTPAEGDRFIVQVRKTNQAGDIVVYNVTPTYDSNNISSVRVDKDKFLAKIDGYHNIGSTLLSHNTENVYCLVNNVLPAAMRGNLQTVAIDGGDVASLVMAAKLLIDNGLLGGDGDTDYSKLLADDELVDQLIDAIMRSKMLDKNLTTIINSIIVMATGDKIIEIHEEDWSENKADDIKALFKVVGKVFKYQDKFSDISSLTKEELDDLFGAIGDALTCGIISANIGRFVDYLNDQNLFGSFKLIGMDKQYWTKEEAMYLKDGLMIFVDMLMAEDSNIMSQLFQLAESDKLDSLLKSRFLILNIVNNLYNFAGEGGELSEFLCLDSIEKNDERWFDTLNSNGEVVIKGELRLLLTNAAKLFKGINDMGDTENLIRELIGNIGSLTNEIGADNDDVGEILASVVLSDTLIKFMKSLPERTNGILKIDNPDQISWRDENSQPGELRRLLKAINILLIETEIDENGQEQTVVLYDKLLSDDLGEKIGIFLDLEDDEIDLVLDSIVITDTTKGLILDYSEGEEAFLYLRNREKTEQEWSDCLSQFLISARILLETTDEQGNKTYSLDKLQGNDTSAFLGMLLDMSDEEIDKLTESEIIVDTLADKLIQYSNQNDSVLAVPGHLSGDGWTTDEWETEERHMIKSLTLILGNDSSKFDDLGKDADSLISMITKLSSDDPEEDKLPEVLLSDVITATMAKQILKYGEGANATLETANVKSFDLDDDLDDWRDEEDKLIRSAKLLLADEDGNVNINKLGESTDKLFEYIVNLTKEELDKVVESIIFTDTIAKNIRSFGEGPNPTLITSGTDGFGTDEWRVEIEDIIYSVKVLIAEYNEETQKYAVDVSTLSDENKINQMFTKIVAMKSYVDPAHKEEDELGQAIASIVIEDTLIKQIKNQDSLTINESDSDFSWKDTNLYKANAEEGELRKFIMAIKLLFADKDEQGNDVYNVEISGLNGDNVIDRFRKLNNDMGGENDQVGDLFNSMIIKDTMVQKIIDMDGTSLVVRYEADDAKWVDYEVESIMQPGELRLIHKALTKLFSGDKANEQFSNLSSTLGVDELLDMSDSDIEDILESCVIKYTASKEVVDVLTGASLTEYIELSKDYEGHTISMDSTQRAIEQQDMVAVDLTNLVKTLKDLKGFGVDYNEFSFSNFQSAYETEGDAVPDSLQRSRLIIHSMSKMMEKILSDSNAGDDILGVIVYDLTEEEWRVRDVSNKQPFEEGFDKDDLQMADGFVKNAELRKVFKVMNALQTFNVATFDINNEGVVDSLKDINESKVTHEVVPTVIDKSLTSIDSWKYNASVARELTIAEWDDEIDVFSEILRLAEGINMNSLDVTNVETATLGKVVKTMALSRYLDSNVLAEKVKEGIESTFSNAQGLEIHVNGTVHPYTPKAELDNPALYSAKIVAWNGDDITIELINASTELDPKEGEVDNVMEAIAQLQGISADDIVNIIPGHNYTVALASAARIGNFLDQCHKTIMLREVPADLFASINSSLELLGKSIDYDPNNTSDGYCYGLLNDFVEENTLYYIH